jgi:hypothetical protein
VYYDVSLIKINDTNFSQALLDTGAVPENVWRDTVFIPDMGFTRIYQRFGGGKITWVGKTVFHCHFLDHEDQGMISAITIEKTFSNEEVLTDSQPVAPTDSPLAAPTSPPTDSSSARSNGMPLAAAFALSTSFYTFMM